MLVPCWTANGEQETKKRHARERPVRGVRDLAGNRRRPRDLAGVRYRWRLSIESWRSFPWLTLVVLLASLALDDGVDDLTRRQVGWRENTDKLLVAKHYQF